MDTWILRLSGYRIPGPVLATWASLTDRASGRGQSHEAAARVMSRVHAVVQTERDVKPWHYSLMPANSAPGAVRIATFI